MGAKYRGVMSLYIILSLLATVFLFASLASFPKSSGLKDSLKANSDGMAASSSLAAQGNANNLSEVFSLNGLSDSLAPIVPAPPPVISNNGTINYNGTDSNGKPEQQNSASESSMWIEPSTLTFSSVNVSVGTMFNVTVWLNMTGDIFSYEIALHYDRNVLQCTRAGYTSENSSQYFLGHASDMPPIRIDYGFLGNGSVLAGEALYGNDAIPGPRNASLIWIEFEILQAPSGGTLAGKLDLSTEYPTETFVLDNNLQSVPITPSNASYSFAP